MHTIGKVFLWLSVIAAIGTVVLAGKLLEKRNTFTQRLDTLKKDDERLQQTVVAKRAEHRTLKQDAAQIMVVWDKYWNDVPVNVQPDGTLVAGVGTNAGVGTPATPEPPTLHLFMPGQDGAPVYVGPFQGTVRENDVALRPTWRVRPAEIATWRPGNWRLRSQVPAVYVGHFRDFQIDLTRGEESLAEKQQNLVVQQQQVAVSQAQLKTRQEELLGFENPPPKSDILSTEWTKGLVAALQEEEQTRNEELAELDRLRREVKAAFRRQELLIARNRRLTNSLPGATPAAPSEVSSTAAAR